MTFKQNQMIRPDPTDVLCLSESSVSGLKMKRFRKERIMANPKETKSCEGKSNCQDEVLWEHECGSQARLIVVHANEANSERISYTEEEIHEILRKTFIQIPSFTLDQFSYVLSRLSVQELIILSDLIRVICRGR